MELKPCPFCGGVATFERLGDSRTSTIVRCEDCGCSLENPETFDHGKQWNTRATDPLLKEMAEALEKAIRSVSELIGYSRGVDGLHLNGNVATWESLRTGGVFEEWLLEFDEAQEVLQKYHEQENNK